VSQDCFSCGACLRECPVGAIVPTPKCYRIDDRVCLDCGACVPTCPVEAIVPLGSPKEIAQKWARSVVAQAAE
jgi:ferredoxin